jgi:hypothetical protein
MDHGNVIKILPPLNPDNRHTPENSNMALAPTRVAVVGGGISGSVCAALLRATGIDVTLFDRSARTLGGRASSRRPESGLAFDSGAQFLVADDVRMQRLLQSPLMAGIVRPWDGRFAVLGCKDGRSNVLPREAALASGMFLTRAARYRQEAGASGKEEEQDEALAAAEKAINFCGFLESDPAHTTGPGNELHDIESSLFIGRDGVGSICSDLLKRAGVDTILSGTTVSDVKFSEANGGRWFLQTRNNIVGPEDGFSHLVLANHDPDFAATTVEALAKASASAGECEMASAPAQEAIAGFTAALRGLEAKRSPRYSLMVAFDRPSVLDAVPFDAASLQGSQALSFVSRDSTKRSSSVPPGGVREETDAASTGTSGRVDRECWVAQSTAELALWVDSLHPGAGGASRDERRAATRLAQETMWTEFERILAPHISGRDAHRGSAQSLGEPCPEFPAPTFIQARRWGAGFFEAPLRLDPPGLTHNDAVTFAPWRLAVAGDYLGHRQGMQEAALSGAMAADRIAGWIKEGQTSRA